ncbi:MAG: hypothetical protein E6J73_01385 [Deltaproteobacteria bacterium]|jgi:hypothetical protein|nr:MAG: hypothetical protein E6J73_01385 [Deltaproteobacteria bacterium]
MSDHRDEKLESLLHSRRVEAARLDLATRISLKAQTVPQIQNISLWQSLRQLFSELHLPKPGYVLASALVLGMVMGFNTTPDNSTIQDANYTTTQSMIPGDEGFL